MEESSTKGLAQERRRRRRVARIKMAIIYIIGIWLCAFCYYLRRITVQSACA